MFIAYAVVGILLAAALSASAFAMVTRHETIVASMTGLGLPESWLPRLASSRRPARWVCSPVCGCRSSARLRGSVSSCTSPAR